jgi:C4-dicarboxylate-specific signal transduction histidine kinase
VKAERESSPGKVRAGVVSGHRQSLFEAALAQVCEVSPSPCAVFDPHADTLVLANPAFRAEFGAAPQTRAHFEQSFEPLAMAADGEVFCPRTGRWYAFHWSSLQGPDDSAFTMLSAQNLTERMETMRQHRALQEQLLSSSRVMSVGEMATTLAHEINQPLATIVNCLAAARTLLGQRGHGAQRLRQTLDLAFEQADQAVAVVARIREFVRTREPRREPHSLSALIERVVQLQQLEAQKHRVRMRVDLPDNAPLVLVDRVMVEQVLVNLVRNAIEAMRSTRPADRLLTIAAGVQPDERVEVRVTDRGAGIAATDEPQLFTPFFTTKPNGMGIGLAICRSIIEFHEGQLCFEREAAGGSVFAFTLPTVAAS